MSKLRISPVESSVQEVPGVWHRIQTERVQIHAEQHTFLLPPLRAALLRHRPQRASRAAGLHLRLLRSIDPHGRHDPAARGKRRGGTYRRSGDALATEGPAGVLAALVPNGRVGVGAPAAAHASDARTGSRKQRLDIRFVYVSSNCGRRDSAFFYRRIYQGGVGRSCGMGRGHGGVLWDSGGWADPDRHRPATLGRDHARVVAPVGTDGTHVGADVSGSLLQ